MQDKYRITQNKAFYFTPEFCLFLVVGFLPTIVALFLSLWTMDTAGANIHVPLVASNETVRWLIIDLLPGVLGMLTVSVLAFVGIIDIGRVKWNQVLMAFLLVLLCDEQFGYKLVDVSETIGEHSGLAVSVFEICIPVFSLVTVWRWFVLCIYLVAVSGRIRKANVVLLVVAAILIVWSLFMTIFGRMFFKMLRVDASYLQFTHDLSDWFYRTTWVNRLIVLCVALVSAGTQWRWHRTAVCILIKTGLTGLMSLLLSLYILQLGSFRVDMVFALLTVAELIPYLMIGVICVINLYLRKKHQKLM